MHRSLAVAAAAAIVLTGCASLPPARLQPEVQIGSGSVLDTCEAVIYRAEAGDADTALRCASVVGVWQ